MNFLAADFLMIGSSQFENRRNQRKYSVSLFTDFVTRSIKKFPDCTTSPLNVAERK
jgi:hypothetical protein